VIILSHPTANQNVRQTALALAEAKLLKEFWTGVHWKKGGIWDRCLGFSGRLQKELRRRSFPPEVEPFVRTSPGREWGRLVCGQLGLGFLATQETGPLSTDAVYRSLDRRVARRISSLSDARAIYAYDDGAMESFRVARQRGLKCIYDHPTAYFRTVRQLQDEEAGLHPEWACTLASLADSPEKLARKEQELALADLVIVASTFSKKTLLQGTGLPQPVEVIPYGAPPVGDRAGSAPPGARLRVLFVGALTQAKGLSYLLEAVLRLERQVEFTLIGRRVSPTIPRPDVLNRFHWFPSLPHAELLEEMSRHDVLVFPSLHEGFGLVIAEAMSQGLVVITTPNTAGPDLITDGVDGFIVPIRSSEAIEEKLDFLRSDAKVLAGMKDAAQQKASARLWATYRQRVASVARALIQ
jgi:glycosyltransferase involved in cell wall biosynthesis